MKFTHYQLYDLLNRPRPLWLPHADFSEVDLRGANFSGAYLYHANFNDSVLTRADFSQAELSVALFMQAKLDHVCFRSATLTGASLSDAMLIKADLSNARVEDKQLAQAKYLLWSTMPDGKIYSGKYRLPAEIETAKASGIDIENPEAMAQNYRVSIEEYLTGQAWADEYLPRLRYDT